MKAGLCAAIVGVAFAAVYSGAAAGRIGGEWFFDVYKADRL